LLFTGYNNPHWEKAKFGLSGLKRSIMNKTELLTILRESRKEHLQAIEGLTEEEMNEPGVIGDWSVKDILSHLTRWEAELVKMLWQISQGITPSGLAVSETPEEVIDELNARWVQEDRDRSLSQVLEDFHGVRKQTIRRVEALSEEELTDAKRYAWLGDVPLWKWVAIESYEHDAEHFSQIQAWREKRGV
jgi:hypothetical protein